MKLKPKQRRDVIRSINNTIAEYNQEAHVRMRFIQAHQITPHLVRVSRMIANLNGVAWPE